MAKRAWIWRGDIVDPVEFYEECARPETPNSMVLEITSNDPDPTHTFSMEAIENVAEQMKMFVLARVYAHSQDMPVKKARVYLTFREGDDDQVEPQSLGIPWWTNEFRNGTTVMDGERRIRGLDT